MKKLIIFIFSVFFIGNVFSVNNHLQTNLVHDNKFIMNVKSDYEVDINADMFRCQNQAWENLDLTIDINTSGANGLEATDYDTNGELNDKWYEVYVIAKNNGDVAGLLNESGTSIDTMPSQYVYKRLVGYVRNDTNSNFVQYKKNTLTGYVDRGCDFSGYDFSLANLTRDAQFHDLDLSAIIPPSATGVQLSIQIRDDIRGNYILVAKKGNTSSMNRHEISVQYANMWGEGSPIFACDENQVISYYVNNSGVDYIYITVTGWLESEF